MPDFGAAVWRATELGCAAGATLATGHAALDAQLPGAGWPVGAICEILQPPGQRNEWRLLMPALRVSDGTLVAGPVVLVGPPHVPFEPGLAAQGLDARRLLWVLASAPDERLWAAEQALRCAGVLAVLVWLSQVRPEQLRRLQMAAQGHGKLLFVMRPTQAQSESSPAVLRLLASTQPDSDALLLHILKRRGPPLDQPLSLPARPARLAALLAMHRGDTSVAAPGPAARGARHNGFLQEGDDALGRTASLA
ncbi:translesion DNA synthesis-associated protein ImuA [Rhodoferax sp.]|uniref:translesion DNA synthesis-associated protein ImuA n=1 Tax=Rhodoferax sp. TaxID=50421 RepID=UPI002636F858|nr:translesion DNA synthesis-associated protein ImuA [Rhodoferax sp.]